MRTVAAILFALALPLRLDAEPPVLTIHKPKAVPEAPKEDLPKKESHQSPKPTPVETRKTKIFEIDSIPGWKVDGTKSFFYRAAFAVEAHGAPEAHHPQEAKALEKTRMAGKPGDWKGLVTHNGRPDGKPLIQGPKDPAPGYYISATSLGDRTKKKTDPARYVNALKIPYIVLPEDAAKKSGARLGDFAVVYNRANGKLEYAIFADVGHEGKLGEGSMALAEALGLNPRPRNGGTKKKDFLYLVFIGSGNGKPRSADEICAQGKKLFDAWGGLERLKKCVKD